MDQKMKLSLQVKYLRQSVKGKLKYATSGSAGIDLVSAEDKPVLVGSVQHVTIHTGIAIAIPQGYVGILAPRSSMGRKGVRLANTIGVIDSDYRGEILVDLVVKQGKPAVQIFPGDRFVQLLLLPVLQCNIEEVQDLPDTERGAGGFGSTG